MHESRKQQNICLQALQSCKEQQVKAWLQTTPLQDPTSMPRWLQGSSEIELFDGRDQNGTKLLEEGLITAGDNEGFGLHACKYGAWRQSSSTALSAGAILEDGEERGEVRMLRTSF